MSPLTRKTAGVNAFAKEPGAALIPAPPTTNPHATSSEGSARYWRSVAELENQPEFIKFLQKEFPDQDPETMDPLSRRRFMQLMGASLALAGVTGCRRWEEDHVVPLSRRPSGYVPSNAYYFATSWELGGVAQPLWVKSVDGRPIKVAGNPHHPASGGGESRQSSQNLVGGATGAMAQASILGMYDPDRSQSVLFREKDGRAGSRSFRDLEGQLAILSSTLAGGKSAGLHVLSEASSSPSMARLRREFSSKFPRAKWHEYEPLSRDNERLGLKQGFGRSLRSYYQMGRARTILALDTDLFIHHPDALRHAREFASTRQPPVGSRGKRSRMSRLYAVESVFSTTGAAADHRLPLRAELGLPFLLKLESALWGGSSDAEQTAFGDSHDPYPQAFMEALARDLRQAGRRALLAVGPRQPAAAHVVAARINERLGVVGTTLHYLQEKERISHLDDIAELSQALAKSASTLIVIGGNPVYNAPVDIALADNLAAFHQRGGTSMHLSLYDNETSARCRWHIPQTHYLEAWADAKTWDDENVLAQPLVEPLYKSSLSPLQLVHALVDGHIRGTREIVLRTHGMADSAMWRKAVHQGFFARRRPRYVVPKVVASAKNMRPPLSERQKKGGALANGALEITFTHSNQVYDGRFANNSWLQEIPDFLTKSVWDNYAMISPRTAHLLGVENNTKIELSTGERTLRVPVYVMPGQAPYAISVALGYGRTRAGVVGGHAERDIAPVGVNAFTIRTTAGFYYAVDGSIGQKNLGAYEIGNTQDHFAIEAQGRQALEGRLGQLIKETTLKEYKEQPDFAKNVPGPKVKTLWDEHQYEGYKWGMATDLSACIGCNACVVACQAENNIPVVGKEEVLNHREMQWLRIDRYFKGDKNNPEVVGQPVACQQCEKAPCEQVCPVGATVHSSEGLNDMVYNRCIGTRYCLNNCPYKVRRFNFLDYHKQFEEARNKVRKLLFNPDVTVRSRGVMEKCTFCVQRIQEAKIKAHNERRRVGEVKNQPGAYTEEIATACQEACPTGAIVFGDLNAAESRVAKLHREPRAYALLAEYETTPRNLYLARIKNPNPTLVPKEEHNKEEHNSHKGGHH